MSEQAVSAPRTVFDQFAKGEFGALTMSRDLSTVSRIELIMSRRQALASAGRAE